jgi:hypothetical protein
MTVPITRPLHVSIATFSPKLEFTRELQLIKTGLLYADQTTFYNMAFVAYATAMSWSEGEGQKDVDEFIERFVQAVSRSQGKAFSSALLLQQVHEIIRASTLGLIQVGFVEEGLQIISSVGSTFRSLRADPDFQITDGPAIEPRSEVMEAANAATTMTMAAHAKFILDTLKNGNTLPLVDQEFLSTLTDIHKKHSRDTMTEAMQSYPLPSTALSEETLKNAKEISLAVDLFARLPTFETASIDEILDIRRELNSPLIAFRSQVIELADQIHAAPWDKDFPREAERLVRRGIEPAILHLEEDIRSNRLLSKLGYKILKDPLEVGGATGLGFLVGSFGGVAASFLGAAAGIGIAALDVYREWKEKRKELERNQVYFYYQAGQRLKR